MVSIDSLIQTDGCNYVFVNTIYVYQELIIFSEYYQLLCVCIYKDVWKLVGNKE